MSFSFLAVFLTTVLVASITPGPSMLLALNHGICFGWRRALATTFGCMMLYATAGARIQGLFRRARFRAAFQRGVGATLVGLGAGLALERR